MKDDDNKRPRSGLEEESSDSNEQTDTAEIEEENAGEILMNDDEDDMLTDEVTASFDLQTGNEAEDLDDSMLQPSLKVGFQDDLGEDENINNLDDLQEVNEESQDLIELNEKPDYAASISNGREENEAEAIANESDAEMEDKGSDEDTIDLQGSNSEMNFENTEDPEATDSDEESDDKNDQNSESSAEESADENKEEDSLETMQAEVLQLQQQVDEQQLDQDVDENQFETKIKELLEENNILNDRMRVLERLSGAQSEKLLKSTNDLEKVNAETQRLQQQLENSERQLISAVQREKELVKQVDELTGQGVPAKLERSRLKEENATLQTEREIMREENEEQARQILKAKREIAEQKNSLLQKAQEKDLKVSHMETELKRSEEYQESLLSNVRNLNEQLATLEKNKIESESVAERELGAQKAMIQAQKETVQHQESQLNTLNAKVRELNAEILSNKQMFNDALEAERTKYEADIAQAQNSAREEIGKVIDRLQKTSDELDEANKTILSLGSGDQASFSTSVLSRSGGSTSVTQMVSQLIHLKGERAQDKKEIARLTKEMHLIQTEIENKEPLVQELKGEYDKLLNTFDTVNDKYERASKTVSELKHEVRMISQQKKIEEDKTKCLKQENEDLSRQVSSLLRAQQKRQANFFGDSITGKNAESALGSLFQNDEENVQMSGHEVISAHLVEISSVEDLQQKNQELIRTVRQLTTDLEQAEASGEIYNREKEMEQRFSSIVKQVNDMKQERKRQATLIKTISQERDLYRNLSKSNVATQEQHQLMDATPKSNVDEEMVIHGVSKKELDNIKEEYSQFREQAKLSDEKFTELVDKLKTDILESRKKSVMLEAELTFEKRKVEKLDNEVDYNKKELDRLKTAETRLESDLNSLEKLLENAKDDLSMVQHREKKVAIEVQQLKVDKRLLERENEQLQDWCEEYKVQRETQAKVLDNFKSIEHSLNSEHNRTLQTMKAQIEQLRERVNAAETDLFNSKQDIELKEARWKERENQLESDVSKRRDEEKALSMKLASKEREVEALQKQEEILSKQLKQANQIAQQIKMIKLDHARNKIDTEQAIQLELGEGEDIELDGEKLKQILEKLETLKKELDVKTETMETFKSIAEASEQALNDLKRSEESQQEKLKAEISALKKQLAEAEAIRSDLEAKLNNNASQMSDAQAQIKQLEEQQAENKNEFEAMKKKCNFSEEEIRGIEKQLESSTENYARELRMHAESTSKMNELKSKISALSEERNTLKEELDSLKGLSRLGVDQLEKEKDALERENEHFKVENLESRKQSQLLSDQVKALTFQLEALQQQQAGLVATTTARETTEVEQEVERLRSLLQLTTKQKDDAFHMKNEIMHEMDRTKAALKDAEEQLAKVHVEVETLRQNQDNNVMLTEEENKKMVAALDENIVLRNINVHLTVKLKELEINFKEKDQSLKDIHSKIEEVKKKEDEINASVSESKQREETLKREVEMYKARHQSLMQRFGERVDPETHEKLTKKVEGLEAQIKANQKERTELEQKILDSSKADAAEIKEKLEIYETELTNARERNKKLQQLGKSYKKRYTDLVEEMKDLKESVGEKSIQKQQQPVVESKAENTPSILVKGQKRTIDAVEETVEEKTVETAQTQPITSQPQQKKVRIEEPPKEEVAPKDKDESASSSPKVEEQSSLETEPSVEAKTKAANEAKKAEKAKKVAAMKAKLEAMKKQLAQKSTVPGKKEEAPAEKTEPDEKSST